MMFNKSTITLFGVRFLFFYNNFNFIYYHLYNIFEIISLVKGLFAAFLFLKLVHEYKVIIIIIIMFLIRIILNAEERIQNWIVYRIILIFQYLPCFSNLYYCNVLLLG